MCAAGIKWKELKKIVIANKKQDIRANRALKNWPIDGRIIFSNVKMRYKPTAGFALDGVNLVVKHGETVGIVGRTGSGKSSLLMGLFRMFELAVRLLSPSRSNLPTALLHRMEHLACTATTVSRRESMRAVEFTTRPSSTMLM